MADGILLRGVKTHNLRNLNIEIPYRAITVVTGVSGSGKSSLVFDTLYAEGQRRFVESLSSYARQFLERMEKPDIESIKGILPSIAIEQKNVITNARSTVGTQTEVGDYLRLLFARLGKTHCSKCGKVIVVDTPESVVQTLFQSAAGARATIGFSVALDKKMNRYGEEIVQEYEKQGFSRMKVDGTLLEIGKGAVPKSASSLWVVVDELDIQPEQKARWIESLETAFQYGRGCMEVEIEGATHRFCNRFSCASCGIEFKEPTPNLFSFNSPLGACSECQGFGRVIMIDWNLVVPNPQKSLSEGAIEPWTKPSAKREFQQLQEFCKSKRIPLEKPFCDLDEEQKCLILKGDGTGDYFSVENFFHYLEKKTYKMHIRIFLSKYRAFQTCSACHGARLKPEALQVKLANQTIADMNRMSVGDLRNFFDSLQLSAHESEIAAPVLLEIKKRLRFLDEVGLGYLTLDRTSRTLSGGEAQRINLATSLGSALVDTLYVLDEPSIGLHERDNELLIRLLRELRDLGNTIVVVEHDRTMIEAADHLIDLGPYGGEKGGDIVYSGPFKDLRKSTRSLTAKYFLGELTVQREKHEPVESKEIISVSGAVCHNLKGLSLDLPLRQLVAITGVSGSGKSTFLYDVLYANYLRFRGKAVSDPAEVKKIDGFSQISDIVLIDQSPIGRTPRSNPATYIKVFDEIRRLFAATREAKAKHLTPGFFSFNVSGGRCERCEGAGLLKVEMHFLADVYVVCESCQGKRYQTPALDIQYRGKNIHEVLQMTVDEALRHFEGCEQVRSKLSLLSDMGLGYLCLGQRATTLSGGEAQRLKLVSEMNRPQNENVLYLFDEPTTGLHYRDIALLLSAFDGLLEKGHSVCVIEHNMEVIKCADHVIDLGPEGGEKGGQVVFSGSIDGLLQCAASYTGKYLKQYLQKSTLR